MADTDQSLYNIRYNQVTQGMEGAGGGSPIWTPLTLVADGGINRLTGDITAGPGVGSQLATLAAVNSNIGSFTSANITVDAKGRITAAANGSSALVTNVVQSTQSGQITVTSSTYTTTGLTATITPSTNTKKIRITVSGVLRNDNASITIAQLTVKRGAVELSMAPFSGTGFIQLRDSDGTSFSFMESPAGFSWIDSPATINATTYTVFLSSTDNTSPVYFQGSQILNLEEIH